MISPESYIKQSNFQEAPIIAATPDIGQGNPTETRAVTQTLQDLGIEVVAHYPKGMWVQIGSEFHIRMTADTKRTMEYAKSSANQRDSLKTLPLKFELKNFIVQMLKKYPDAQFFLTPQNMLGEIATQVEVGGKKFSVIMVLPDAMGKFSPDRVPTQNQQKIHYLVWNENAYQVLQNDLGLQSVQLIDPVDPLAGFNLLTESEIANLGLPEIFEQEDLALIKLSGSGGDANLINEAVAALWNNSGVNSVIFPGQERTGKKLNKQNSDHKPIKQFFGEGIFYNAARNMIDGKQLLLTYPSEQFKHVMVLSKSGKSPRVTWLPPRGEHEVINLANFILLASEQGIITTICMPKEYEGGLDESLKSFGFKRNVHYQYTTPDKLSKEQFQTVPEWQEKLVRTPLTQAILHISSL